MSGRAKTRNELLGFGLIVLAVVGIGTGWGWTIVQLIGSVLHAASLLLQNPYFMNR